MTRSRVVRVHAMGAGHVTRRDAERVRDETSGIGPGSSGRRDGVGTGRGTSHNITPNWADIDNGIVQGDPLSMLLYLFYNADLISMPKKEEVMITYVDDACYYVEGSDFGEACDKLCDMMYREQGGYTWLELHNS